MAEPRTRTVVQAPRFGRSKKRLPAAAQRQIDEAVKGLLADPLSGEPKVGALKGDCLVGHDATAFEPGAVGSDEVARRVNEHVAVRQLGEKGRQGLPH